MNKKPYSAPVVKIVQLKVMNAILAVCHTSAVTFDPRINTVPCSAATGCYQGPSS